MDLWSSETSTNKDKAIEEVMKEFDLDDDSLITEEEFVAGFARWLNAAQEIVSVGKHLVGKHLVTRYQRLPSIGSLFTPQSFASSSVPRTPLIDYHHSLRPQFSSDQYSSSDNRSGAQISHSSITIDQIRTMFPDAMSTSNLITSLANNEQVQEGIASNNSETIRSLNLFSREAKNVYLDICVPLYQAALEGNWKIAEHVIEKYPQAIRGRITRGGETVLHIAAAAMHTQFLEVLVKLMTPEDLELENYDGNTALCFAAATGTVKIAKLMVEKNKNLPHIRGSRGVTPLYMAALLGHRDMVNYLFAQTRQEQLTEGDCIGLLFATIGSNLYDMALQILELDLSMATARDGNEETALHLLARKPSAFGDQLGYWRRCIYSIPGMIKMFQHNISMHNKAHQLLNRLWKQVLLYDDSEISTLITEPTSLLFVAVELGNVEFITVLIRSYPDLIWRVDNHNRTIFHVAIAYRQRKILNLIYEIGAIKDLIAYRKDENGNNMLHLAGNLAPRSHLNKISGAALQMQQELLWFKEVEKIVQPSYREMKNSDGKIARDLFTEQHKFLMKEGEQWMKDTSSSCMVVATLIATVMFAAAFTVPGGNNDTGSPIFLENKSFMVFATSDALSLFSSTTSILMFLSILTSRYAETDFLLSLPLRLIIGLATLFISIATMMVAFSATFFIVLNRGLARVAIPIALLACVPVTLFALLQFRLFGDMVCSTYRASFLFRSSKHTAKKHTWTGRTIPL